MSDKTSLYRLHFLGTDATVDIVLTDGDFQRLCATRAFATLENGQCAAVNMRNVTLIERMGR